MSGRPGRWLAAAAVLAVLALGLPWEHGAAGAQVPSRVAVVAAVALVATGLVTGRDRLLPAAVLIGAVGVVLGQPSATPGRLALAAAVTCLAIALRADGRAVLPG